MKKWKKYKLETVPEAEDVVISILGDAGIEGAEIEDHVPFTDQDKGQMFADVAPDPVPNDGKAFISFYLDEDADSISILEEIRSGLSEMAEFMDLGTLEIRESVTEDEDWINNWKEHFHQFCIDDVLIIPSWENVEPEDQDKLVIHIDPGTAFGTGKHETTRSCIRALRKMITGGERVLDVGTGSGILMMLALKFGASHGVGTDLDPFAVPAVEENMIGNGIPETDYEMYLGNIIDDEKLIEKVKPGSFDIVVANILAEVLIPLTPVIPGLLKEKGIYITAGIIDFKEKEVADCIRRNGMEILEVIHDGEWVCFISRKL